MERNGWDTLWTLSWYWCPFLKKALIISIVLFISLYLFYSPLYSSNTNIKTNYHDFQFCPYCSKEVRPDFEFCTNCSRRLVHNPQNKNEEEISINLKDTDIAKRNPHNLIISFNTYIFDYKEELPLPYKSTEYGWIPGIYLSYLFQSQRVPFHGKFLLEYTEAETDYDGTTQTGIPLKDNTINNFFTIEGDVGYGFILSANTINLIPYVGIGHRIWNRGLGRGDKSAPLTEDYSWFFSPVGIRTIFYINEDFIITIDAAVKFMFEGKIKINLSEADPGYNDPEGILGNRIGFKAELPLLYRIYSNIFLSIIPWYEYSGIKKSNIFLITYNNSPYAMAYEPSSITHQYGLNFGCSIQF